jgi:hypothetical protein
LATPLLVASLAGTAFAQSYSLQILYTNTAGHPANVVPGIPGSIFNAGGASTSAFDRPAVSSNGAHLAIVALAETAIAGVTSANDDCLLVDGTLALREGDVCPWPAGAETVGLMPSNYCVNNSANLLLDNNSSGPTTADDYLVLRTGGVWSILAQEGQLVSPLVPGLTGDAGAGKWSSVFDGFNLTNGDVPYFRADNLTGLTTGTTNDDIVALGGGFRQKGVWVPFNQAGGATNAWEIFDADDLYVSPDGSVVLIQGDLLGATTSDDVLVLNDIVFIQEGSILLGSTFVNPVANIVKPWVDHAGNWYARGNNATTGDDWVVRNGAVVADSTGTWEVVPGSGEHWTDDPSVSFADCFFAFDGDSFGNYIIAGLTDFPTLTRNAVIAFYDANGNSFIVAREGDAVDMNGNGIDDDDRYINTFGNDDIVLLDDGRIITIVTLKNGAGTSVDQALIQLTPVTGACTFRNGTGVNPVGCFCLTPPKVGTNWNVDVTNGPNTVTSLLLVGFEPLPAFPLFTWGEIMINPLSAVITFSPPFPMSIPVEYGWHGDTFTLQGLRIDTTDFVLTNAQDAVIGY